MMTWLFSSLERKTAAKYNNGKSSFNLFLVNVPILYPLKTPENQKFSGVVRSYEMGTLARIS